MRTIAIADGLALGLAAPVAADPIGLLAPDDPNVRSGWHPPAAPTGGVQAYAPVDAKDWLKRGGAGAPGAGAQGPGGMEGMPSMSGMKGMGGMNGMGGMKGMPGMGR